MQFIYSLVPPCAPRTSHNGRNYIYVVHCLDGGRLVIEEDRERPLLVPPDGFTLGGRTRVYIGKVGDALTLCGPIPPDVEIVSIPDPVLDEIAERASCYLLAGVEPTSAAREAASDHGIAFGTATMGAAVCETLRRMR